jgi:hypothetical protein
MRRTYDICFISLLFVLACGSKQLSDDDDGKGGSKDGGTGAASGAGARSSAGAGGSSKESGGSSAGTPSCAAGYALCGSSCVDLGFDGTNCGTCGHRCASEQTCREGACEAVGSGGTGGTGGSAGTGGSSATGGTSGSGGSTTSQSRTIACKTVQSSDNDQWGICSCSGDTNTGTATYTGIRCDSVIPPADCTVETSGNADYCCRDDGYPNSGGCTCYAYVTIWACHSVSATECSCGFLPSKVAATLASGASYVADCNAMPGTDGVPWTCYQLGSECHCVEGLADLPAGAESEPFCTTAQISRPPVSCPTGTAETYECDGYNAQACDEARPPCDASSCNAEMCAGDFCCSWSCGSQGCESDCSG